MSDNEGFDPGNPMNEHPTRKHAEHVREALMRWDAIGVSDEPGAADEYDCMIGPLLQQLHDGHSPGQIASWIDTERADHFDLPRDRRADKNLAKSLWRWWRALQ